MNDLVFNIAPWQWWLIVGLLLWVLEIATPSFVLGCFGVGALLAAVPAVLGLDLVWQILLFAVGSVVMLLYLRPLILRLSRRRGLHTPTGAEALIGRVVLVSDAVVSKTDRGRVAVDGDSWRAVSADDEDIARGEEVKIIARNGIILTVQRHVKAAELNQ